MRAYLPRPESKGHDADSPVHHRAGRGANGVAGDRGKSACGCELSHLGQSVFRVARKEILKSAEPPVLLLALSPVSWARAQMAFTLGTHIILVPLGVS